MDLGLAALFCLCSALATAFICSRAERIGRAANVISNPDGERRLHGRPTPLIGGLAILLPVYLLSMIFSLHQPLSEGLVALFTASALMLVLGFVDDRWAISPVWRLFALCFISFSLLSIEPVFVLHSVKFTLFQHAYDWEL